MMLKMKAVYRDGAFRVAGPCDLPENAEVELTVQGPVLVRPRLVDAGERNRILDRLTDRMQANPLPVAVPQLSREDLHERR